MRCDEFEARLNDLLDRRRDLGGDAALTNHADGCPQCRRLWQSYENLFSELAWLERPAPADDLPERVVVALRDSPRTQNRYWLSAVWAAAAAVAVAVALDQGGQPVDLGVPLAADLPPAVSVAPPVLNEAAPGGAELPAGLLARQATARYADLARDTQAVFTDVAALWPSSAVAGLPAVNDAEQVAVASQVDPAVENPMAAGLKPLADSTAGTMSYLLDILPLGTPSGSSSLPAGAPRSAISRGAI